MEDNFSWAFMGGYGPSFRGAMKVCGRMLEPLGAYGKSLDAEEVVLTLFMSLIREIELSS